MTVPAEPVRWLTPQEQAAWRGLLRMVAVLTSTLNQQLSAESDLSLQDYAVLVCLDEHPEGRMRPFELGRQLGLEKSRLSHQLNRLVDRRLVTRERCPTDQRGWFLGITALGRRARRSAAPGHVAAVRRALVDRLTPVQVAALTDITRAVLGPDGDGQPAPTG